ncbi:MAG: glutathione peroxidase, partial [Alteromonas sp.]|nr:glutathione peroxidase [Alteromonas sp.]
MALYEHAITLNNGEQTTLEQYKGKGFEILGFPCDQFGHQESRTDEDIEQYCSLNCGVSFPLFKKTNVNGPDANPMLEE